MINWVFAILVCVLLTAILMIAGGSIPPGTIWCLLIVLAVVIGRGSVRRWTHRHKDEQ